MRQLPLLQLIFSCFVQDAEGQVLQIKILPLPMVDLHSTLFSM